MKALIAKVLRWALQIAAGLVIVLALLVGVLRLLLPEVSSFTDDIKVAVRESTGFEVDFEFISAGISVYGPELRFSQTRINWPDGSRLADADQVAISLNLFALAAGEGVLPGRIYIEGAAVELIIDEDGAVLVQGRPLEDYLPEQRGEFDPDNIPEGRLQFENIQLGFENRLRGLPRNDGLLTTFVLLFDDRRIDVTGALEPGGDLGELLSFDAELPVELLYDPQQIKADTPWDLWLYADNFRLDPWLKLADIGDIPVIDSQGTLDAAVEFRGLTPVSVATEMDLESVQLVLPDGAPVTLDDIEGELSWAGDIYGWSAVGQQLRIEREGRSWPLSQFELRYARDESAQRELQESLSLQADFLRLDDLLPFARIALPQQLRDAGLTGTVIGDVRDLQARIALRAREVQQFDVDFAFVDAGYLSPTDGFDIRGYSGNVQATQASGQLEITATDASFGVERLFRDVLDIKQLNGLLVWRRTDDGYVILANEVQTATPHGQLEASLVLNLNAELGEPVIDLTATGGVDDVGQGRLYLPKVLPPKVLNWLDQALVGGQVRNIDFALRGPLGEFPFTAEEDGDFIISGDFEDLTLLYAPDWPQVTDGRGRIVFDGVTMTTTENAATVGPITVQNIAVRIPDLRKGVLEVDGQGPTDLSDVLGFLQSSPVGAALGPVFADVGAAGAADYELALRIPVTDLQRWRLDGTLTTAAGEAWLGDIKPRFTRLSGTAQVANTEVTALGLTGTLLEQPVSIDVWPAAENDTDFSHSATVTGNFPTGNIIGAFDLPALPWFEGTAEMRATALLPVRGDDKPPFRLLLESRMEGISSQVPYPLSKAAADSEPVRLELRFPERGTIEMFGAAERGINWALLLLDQPEGWLLERGLITSGDAVPELPPEPGVQIAGYVETVNVTDWVTAFTGDFTDPDKALAARPGQNWQRYFTQADLQIGELIAVGHRFVDVDVSVDFNSSAWDILIRSPWAEGLIELPYDFKGSLPVELAMERLLLIEPLEGDADDSGDYPVDPRELPAIRGTVDDFAIGTFRFGRLDVDVERNRNGLRSRTLTTTADSFSTVMSADWTVLDDAQRSRLRLELNSDDFADTLRKLGYAPLISADSAFVEIDLLWEGGPGMGLVYASTGEIDLNLKDGSVNEVDSAGAKFLGLLSVAYLPRRLSLDFSDMQAEGLAFDRMNGKFTVDFGSAYTCNLEIEGPATDLGIVGRANTITQDIDQVAVVRPHVSNIAPVSAAFLAGPVAGIGTLLITQIFKKPLSNIGESYYTITGPWAEPAVDKVSRSELDTSSFADCESGLPELSPEEIAALEELLMIPEPQQEPAPVVPEQLGSPIGDTATGVE